MFVSVSQKITSVILVAEITAHPTLLSSRSSRVISFFAQPLLAF